VDIGGHNEQLVGNNVSEGTQRPKRQTVSCGGTNVFRSWAVMLGRIGRTYDKAESRKRDVIKGDGCYVFGENLVKATLPRAGWTLHHDAINLQIHRVARQSGMISTMEVEEYFLRRLHESAIQPDSAMPLLGKQLRGYVPDGRQTGTASSKRPAGVD
jgi:hypothetical protein